VQPDVTAPPVATAAPAPAAAPAAAAPAPNLKQTYADWPKKGDERAQPWDHAALGISKSQLDDLHEAGGPNTVSPIVLGHSMPILSSGSGGDQSYAVLELARRLKVLGIDTDVSQGKNPYGTLTQSVMSGIERFREEYGVEEDPTGFGGNTSAGRARANAHVGPWTWEALIRASDAAAS
jgi:hypothetical protein